MTRFSASVTGVRAGSGVLLAGALGVVRLNRSGSADPPQAASASPSDIARAPSVRPRSVIFRL